MNDLVCEFFDQSQPGLSIAFPQAPLDRNAADLTFCGRVGHQGGWSKTQDRETMEQALDEATGLSTMIEREVPM